MLWNQNKRGSVSDVTVKLEAVERGDPIAAKELFALLYAELRRKVEALLRAHEQLGNFMETPNSSAGSPDMLDPTIDEEPSEPGAKNGESTGK